MCPLSTRQRVCERTFLAYTVAVDQSKNVRRHFNCSVIRLTFDQPEYVSICPFLCGSCSIKRYGTANIPELWIILQRPIY